jgi:Tetracyclin repressor-like, C-terminal domain
MRGIVGPERALTAFRMLTAFLHGWISLEAAGLFRLGGDADRDFDAALATILDGIEARARAGLTSASDGDDASPRYPPAPRPKA